MRTSTGTGYSTGVRPIPESFILVAGFNPDPKMRQEYKQRQDLLGFVNLIKSPDEIPWNCTLILARFDSQSPDLKRWASASHSKLSFLHQLEPTLHPRIGIPYHVELPETFSVKTVKGFVCLQLRGMDPATIDPSPLSRRLAKLAQDLELTHQFTNIRAEVYGWRKRNLKKAIQPKA